MCVCVCVCVCVFVCVCVCELGMMVIEETEKEAKQNSKLPGENIGGLCPRHQSIYRHPGICRNCGLCIYSYNMPTSNVYSGRQGSS